MSDDSTGNDFVEAMQSQSAPEGAQATPVTPPVETSTPDQAPPDQVVQTEQSQQEPQAPQEPEDPLPSREETDRALRAAAKRMGLNVTDDMSSDQLAVVALQNLDAVMRQQLEEMGKKEVKQEKPKNDSEWDPDRYFDEAWGAKWDPKFDEAISQGIVQLDEKTGKFAAVPGNEMLAQSVLPELNRSYQKNRENWSKLSKNNFYKEIYNTVKDPIIREAQRYIEEQLSKVQRQTSAESYAQQFDEKNAHWLYAQDPVSKQYVPTEEGQRLFDTVQIIYQTGESDAKSAIDRALKMTGLSNKVGSQAAKPAKQAPAKEPPSQSPQQSFLEKAKQANAWSPNASGPGADPGVQAISNEYDLNTLFTRVYNSR